MKKVAGQSHEMLSRVRQVIEQTVARVLRCQTHHPGKLDSVFEPDTEIIRKGKANKPTEFGTMVEVQEADGQIVVDVCVHDKRPADSDFLVSAVEKFRDQFGHVPSLVAAHSAFYSGANEKARADLRRPQQLHRIHLLQVPGKILVTSC